jgi:pSer/pThr/pTyr-binding forkhead associated (FHA) protein
MRLDSPKVSRRHARITIRGDRAMLEDLGSKNGSFVRNVRIDAPTPLLDGDEVRFGLFAFEFRLEQATGSTETT